MRFKGFTSLFQNLYKIINQNRNPMLNSSVMESLYIEGYLEKEKPGALLFSMSDKRYCKILKEGPAFVYAANPEDVKKGEIKGKVAIRDILDVAQMDDNDKKFEIIVDGRAYKFIAKTAQECTRWVQTLQKLSAHTKEEEARFIKDLTDLHPDMILDLAEEEDEIQTEKKEFFLLQPINMVKNAAKKVVVEAAIGTAVGLVKNGVKGVGSLFHDGKQTTNQEYLAAKKFDAVLDAIDPVHLRSRLKMGMLLREVKEATGLGVVDDIINGAGVREVVERRWCLLISSKPLLAHEVDPKDETTLGKGALPLQVDYDTLYLYEESCDDSEAIDKIPMKDVTHLIIKKMAHSTEQYHFILDLGDKKFNLICPSFNEMTQWLRAIQASRAIAAEVVKSKELVLKNLFWIIKTRDQKDGENKLAQKIENEYEKLTQVETTSIKSLVLVQEKVANEFISIVNACLVCRVPRIDIIKMYSSVYHESVLSALKNYYKKKAQELENGDLFEMIKFLNWYHNALSAYGTSFEDVRIKESLGLLSTIAATNILKRPNLKAIKNILDQFLNNNVDVDSRGRITSSSPKDVFKIMHETLNIAGYCNTECFILKLLGTCQSTLEYFQNGIERYIEDADLINEKLIAICNDVMQFIVEIKDFVSLAQQMLPSNQEGVASAFNDKHITKVFVTLGKKSYQKLAESLLSWSEMASSSKPKARGFIDVDLQYVIGSALQQTEEILDKLHPTYPPKLGAEILKQSVEGYVKTFFEFFEKKLHKKEDLPELERKLEKDPQIFTENFESFKGIRSSDLEKALTPIRDLLDFINSENETIFMSIPILKKEHKDFVKWNAIDQIVRLKTEKAPKEVREKALTACKEAFQEAEKEIETEKMRKSGSEADTDSDSRSDRSFSSQDSVELGSEEPLRRAGSTRSRGLGSTTIRLTIDGMLEMESNFIKDVANLIAGAHSKHKYFSVRNDKMFCFDDKKAESAIMSFNLKEAIECHSEGENSFILLMMDSDVIKKSHHLRHQKRLKEAITRVVDKIRDHEGVTEYKFYAENQHKREMWVKTINNVMNMAQDDAEDTLQLNDPTVQIYKDTTTLFIYKEAPPSLQFEFTKIVRQKQPRVRPEGKPEPPSDRGSQHQPPQSSGGKRRVSLTLTNDALQQELDHDDIGTKPGFCAVLCMKFGFVKPKQNPRGSFYQS